MKNNCSEGSQTSLDKLYEQITAIVETSIFDIGNVINAIVNLDQNNLELQMQDLIHLEMEFGIKYDLIVERLYSRETILFSRSDRFVLVERIDAVFDHVLNDSRRAYSYQPTEIPPAVSSYLLQIAQNIQSIGTPLKRAIIFLFSDFKKAEGLILEIRKLGKRGPQVSFGKHSAISFNTLRISEISSISIDFSGSSTYL